MLDLCAAAWSVRSHLAVARQLLQIHSHVNMHPITVSVSCLLLVLITIISAPPGSCAVSTRSQDSATIPPRKERLPYTPVRDSTRKERLPYTPVKPTTTRPKTPELRVKTTTTKRVPFPRRTTPKPCNCQCNVTEYKPICAGQGADQDTFPNKCQLDCYNCTHNKNYQVVKQGECSK